MGVTYLCTSPPNCDKLKVVTGADANYFYSLLTLIQTLRTADTENQFFLDIWDLGLESWQTDILKTILDSRTSVRSLKDHCEEPFADAFNNKAESFSWKPFCIKASLHNFENILWLDAGVAVTGNLELFFSELVQHGYVFLDNFERKNIDWTSQECLELMYFQAADESGLQISANIIGISNSKESRRLLDDWIQFCSIPESMFSNDSKHRHDQSVLSILIHRRGLTLTPFSNYAYEGPDFNLARNTGHAFLAHRRTFNWFDMNFLVNLHGDSRPNIPI